MTTFDEDWRPLLAELDAWSAAGKIATFWWRDDDAVAPSAALDRMLSLGREFDVPLGLAVIPALATKALAEQLRAAPLVDVLQHGYTHRNHARPGERAAEFGPQRTLDERVTELALGWQMLQDFPRRTPIFVPPWNRYDPGVAPALATQGGRAISAFGPARQLPAGIVECNCHVDIISWRTTRGFAGVAKTVNKFVEHLQARRAGVGAAQIATGVLSHHLVHDDGCWAFLGELFRRLHGHPAARWVRPLAAVDAAGVT